MILVHDRETNMQHDNLRGLAGSVILLLFAGTWLVAAGYTFYSVLGNVSEMSIFWQLFGFGLLAIWGVISCIGTAVAVVGFYGYLKALLTDTNAKFS